MSVLSLLTRASVQEAHQLIKPHIHLTPVLTSTTLSTFASTPQSASSSLQDWTVPTHPRINLFFKCENHQRAGAFKSRGVFHALARLSDEELRRGVATHSSGNHAQALALAAQTRGIPAYIVMPTISVPSKIAATKGYGAKVTFSGPTLPEREAVISEIIQRTGATFVPPYNNVNVILGQGTMALEFEHQVKELTGGKGRLDAIITACGGGGMLSGVATAMAGTGTRVFGAEPSFQGADDCRRGLAENKRITTVKSLTIADGLRMPVGETPWRVISDKTKVHGVFAVTEDQIRQAMKLVIERMKVLLEPSAAVPVAVVLFNEEFRRLVQEEASEDRAWNVGVVLSGGNTTLEAIGLPGDHWLSGYSIMIHSQTPFHAGPGLDLVPELQQPVSSLRLPVAFSPASTSINIRV